MIVRGRRLQLVNHPSRSDFVDVDMLKFSPTAARSGQSTVTRKDHAAHFRLVSGERLQYPTARSLPEPRGVVAVTPVPFPGARPPTVL